MRTFATFECPRCAALCSGVHDRCRQIIDSALRNCVGQASVYIYLNVQARPSQPRDRQSSHRPCAATTPGIGGGDSALCETTRSRKYNTYLDHLKVSTFSRELKWGIAHKLFWFKPVCKWFWLRLACSKTLSISSTHKGRQSNSFLVCRIRVTSRWFPAYSGRRKICAYLDEQINRFASDIIGQAM